MRTDILNCSSIIILVGELAEWKNPTLHFSLQSKSAEVLECKVAS